jgi:hypothetical protein
MNICTEDKTIYQDLFQEGDFPIWYKKYLRKQKTAQGWLAL